jgi:hypothetical protein
MRTWTIGLMFLAVFLILFGIASATNVEIVWMESVTALSSLAAGVLIMFHVLSGRQ